MNAFCGETFVLNGLQFTRRFGPESGTYQAEFPEFVIVKTSKMLADYMGRLKDRQLDSVLELGILRGGSVAFFNEFYKPKRHMAVDIHREEGGLDTFVHEVNSGRRGGRKLLVRYDVSQADVPIILSSYEDFFHCKAEFDLVVDDASHNYALSLATFNGLFPRVKPGGIYVIEDWGWAHWHAGGFQEPDNQEFKNPALSNLVLYCVMACTAGTAGIGRVDITPDSVFVHRNEQPVPPSFRIETSFPTRHRPVTLL